MNMAICLIDAIRNGDVTTARKILNQRKYTNIDSQTSRKDGTALFWACCRGLLDIIRMLLLQGADVNAKTAWGSTPLCAATDNNQIDTARLLIQFGADVNPQTSSGDSPCHLAAYRGFAEVIQVLVEAGADVNLFNNKRHTPIDEAINSGHYNIVKYLKAVSELVKGNPHPDEQNVPIIEPIFLSTYENGNTTKTKDVCSSQCYQPRNVDYGVPMTQNYGVPTTQNYSVPMTQNYSVPMTQNTISSLQLSHNNLSLTTNSGHFQENRMSFRNIP